MKTGKFALKIFSVVLSSAMLLSAFAGCSSNSNEENKSSGNLSAHKENDGKNTALEPKVEDKHLKPDVSSIKLSEPSTAERICETEEECIEVLNTFANPNGNEFDAVSVLGKFRYKNKTDEEIMNKLKNASADWHETVTGLVGEKCIVKFNLEEKTSVDLGDSKVQDWNIANGKEAEAFSNVKCSLSTNYSSESAKISFDIVKTGGRWYLANTSTINKIQNVITNEIYK